MTLVSTILHITRRDAWHRAQLAGVYEPDTLWAHLTPCYTTPRTHTHIAQGACTPGQNEVRGEVFVVRNAS